MEDNPTKQEQLLIDKLQCTLEEAKDVIQSDEKIDKGEKLFELTKEQQQASKEARKTTSATKERKQTTRTKKADNVKKELIDTLITCLDTVADDNSIVINNPEREIEFFKDGRKFKIVLSAPRK